MRGPSSRSAHQHYNPTFQSAQAHKSLLAVDWAGVFARQHRLIENGFALGQVDGVLALVALPFTRIVSLAIYRICI